jgi:molecular chaperone IbpA
MTLKDFNKFFVGYDEATQRLQRLHEQMQAKANISYPPYNLRKSEDHTYLLELAVAGFNQDELDIQASNGELTITAQKRENSGDTEYTGWLHQGIAYRGFTRTFYLDNQYEVLNAELKDGLLKVYLGLQENKKPKKIPISAKAT